MATKPSASINLGLPAIPEVDSPELYGALVPLYNAVRNVMYALDNYTGNTLVTKSEYADVTPSAQLLSQKTAVLYVELGEAVKAGHMINFYNSGGLRGKKSIGGVSSIHAFALDAGEIGDTIPVCLFGLCRLINGLTPGTEYRASVTPGLIAPGGSGQFVGVALAENMIWFNPG